MKALVTGFHMLYRLSPDSKYPWSGENTGPIEIPVLNIPLLAQSKIIRAAAAKPSTAADRLLVSDGDGTGPRARGRCAGRPRKACAMNRL